MARDGHGSLGRTGMQRSRREGSLERAETWPLFTVGDKEGSLGTWNPEDAH